MTTKIPHLRSNLNHIKTPSPSFSTLDKTFILTQLFRLSKLLRFACSLNSNYILLIINYNRKTYT